jgi:proteasome assembly chaperone (PAC2) family protein
MGHVAISAGYFLVAKLGMHILAEFSAHELFDVEHVEVKGGLIRMGRLPRSRFFVWKDPRERHDIVVFIGEAQPPKGRYAFCQRLIEFAQQLGIERVYTFAAMATPMHPEHGSRVFAAATDAESLAELNQLELEVLEDGQIGGLNGVLLGAAAESGLRGACLLGEMPHIFAQLPFPKASLAVLEVFSTIANIQIDLSELSAQAKEVEHKLGELLEKVKEALEEQEDQEGPGEEEAAEFEPAASDDGPSDEDREVIEKLFRQAKKNRSKAYELKSELDRLQLYREYEDRFLDLFKKPG